MENVDHLSILQLLQETNTRTRTSSGLSPEIKTALQTRLLFRQGFLCVVDSADSRTSQEVAEQWTQLLGFVPQLNSSSKLGRHVNTAFSVKIQRKLASTVPPRPIVKVSQEAALGHLEKLCRDAAVAVEVLKYYDSHSLMVSIDCF